MKTNTEKVRELSLKGFTTGEIIAKTGIKKGSVSSIVYQLKKKGILPNIDGRSGREPVKRTRKPKIQEIQIPESSNDGFVVIVGKGKESLRNILSQVGL